MDQERLGERWQQVLSEVTSGFRDWRAAHPAATFGELEAALDERWARARARLLEDAALASRATDLSSQPAAERPRCPDCGARVQARGQQQRQVTVTGDQRVELRRSYAVCPACGAGLFPPG